MQALEEIKVIIHTLHGQQFWVSYKHGGWNRDHRCTQITRQLSRYPCPSCITPLCHFPQEHRGYVYLGSKLGNPCNPTCFRTLYKAELEKIEGVRYLSPHSCRHTYVSQLQALGVDLETIKSIVGHADLDMTRHYLHVQEPIRQAAVQKFNDAFSTESDE